ncbi:MAG: phosphoribosylaminoimidazolesuccinocarboxamide synthase [Methylophilaceae bacterium]|jgi:phosphoribosylaminoimidazole-succinocarboxamide synthase|nr:phosphoribosylaminoimidazolesuccinocarboxamide synthase [Methylophilaceae bacterium]
MALIQLTETSIKSLPLLHKGKVRDIYEVDDKHLLIVTTDRLSAFDVVMNEPIPNKGFVLTQMADFWFRKLSYVVANHLSAIAPESVVSENEVAQVKNRAIVARKLKALPIEAIVRGYLSGSGWKDYQKTQTVCGIKLPQGLKESAKLDEPIFTPSSKEVVGQHDENISFEECEARIGKEIATRIKEISIKLYQEASAFAITKGIIIADTKFEFGLDDENNLVLIDEILTPDSSRFWPLDQYREGVSQPSFDKQFIRDWLESSGWNKTPPPPSLPLDVITKTSQKYLEAFQKLTGQEIKNN